MHDKLIWWQWSWTPQLGWSAPKLIMEYDCDPGECFGIEQGLWPMVEALGRSQSGCGYNLLMSVLYEYQPHLGWRLYSTNEQREWHTHCGPSMPGAGGAPGH